MSEAKSGLGIRLRIAGAAAIATVCLLSAAGTIGFLTMVDATRDSQIQLLREQVDDVQQRLDDGEDRLTTRLQAGTSLRVIRQGQSIPAEAPGTLQIERALTRDDDIVAIVGTISTRRTDRTFQTIRIGLWISVLVTGLTVGVISWLVVDRALSPVRRLTRQAEANVANSSPELLPVHDDSGDEIAELATTFNTMLTKLRQADGERRRFVSDASHELRTPLMVLAAEAELARDYSDTPPSAETEALANAVLDQSGRLTTLVDDLLTLASLDEDQAPTKHGATVTDVLAAADVSSLTSALDPSVGLQLIPDVSRAVVNIVANARRHMTNTVAVDVHLDSTAMATIVIDDDGPGIPSAERDQIFRRFYRPDEGRTRSDGGAGLGLAIAKAEVGRAGGTIIVGDSPLGGARFTLRVPLLETPALP